MKRPFTHIGTRFDAAPVFRYDVAILCAFLKEELLLRRHYFLALPVAVCAFFTLLPGAPLHAASSTAGSVLATIGPFIGLGLGAVLAVLLLRRKKK